MYYMLKSVSSTCNMYNIGYIGYRIMGLEISDAFLGTTARPRLRARVFFCHIENKVVLEVVIDF